MKIGLRTWKTVVAVFVCFLIDEIRKGGLPFYAAIAAILCIQKNNRDSLEEAKKREIATIIGGSWGILFLFTEKYIFSFSIPLFRYFALSIMLIPVIQVSRLLKQEKGTFLMCVIFLCVTVTHGTDNSPFVFALNRIFDTSIGIFVALCINLSPHARRF